MSDTEYGSARALRGKNWQRFHHDTKYVIARALRGKNWQRFYFPADPNSLALVDDIRFARLFETPEDAYAHLADGGEHNNTIGYSAKYTTVRPVEVEMMPLRELE